MNAFFSTSAGAARRSVKCMAVMAVVGVCAVAGSFTAHAAVTTGMVAGRAPAGATVLVSNPGFGIQHRVPVNDEGRYSATWLPIGVYTVSLLQNDQPVAEQSSVQVYVDHGSRVDFSCPNGQCSEVAAN